MTVAELRFLEVVPAKLGDLARGNSGVESELHQLNENLSRLIGIAEGILEKM